MTTKPQDRDSTASGAETERQKPKLDMGQGSREQLLSGDKPKTQPSPR